ncbi:MAG TPA: adenylate/guanylate cyclase domain-containing protein [Chitinophagaceae bacterium]|nr:adenylate/guanylate cyclase domain-containing protein [Chitinophagaceae bacterium]
MAQSRQLAAIMFTDIVGYTSLMGDDEEAAFELLNKNRLLQKPLVERFGGKWIKELGDGVLATFSTVTDAVNCACCIIKGCENINGLKLRIGIHQAEVVFENNDVFGDGVNIASRLQSIAPKGGICISDTVRNNIVNRKEILTRFIKEENLKHVKEPIRIYEIVINSTNTIQRSDSFGFEESRKIIPEKSIAVLPFTNMSNDPEQEYFSDGMAEEILNSLSHLKDLKVAGRTSSFQFKGRNIDLSEIGRKLGVASVLEGSVRKQGNKLRITAQLINTKDGFHLWSAKYDRTMDDVFAIQDEISLAITENLKIILLEKEKEIIAKNVTENTEAYELYLRGRFYLNKRLLFQSLEQFRKAVELDPYFVKAHAGLADAYVILGFYNYLPAKEVMLKAKVAADAAIHLDNSFCEPYCSLGMYYATYEWNWEEAKKNFLKSIQLNPRYVQSHVWFGHYYLCWIEGKFEEGERHLNIAIELEPCNAMSYINKYAVLLTAGKFEEAFITAKQGYGMDPDSVIGNRIMGLAYCDNEQYAEASGHLEFASKLSNYAAFNQVDLINLYTRKGAFGQANVIMEELRSRLNDGKYVSRCIMSFAAGFLGNIDEAMNWLDKAYDQRDPYLCILKYYPFVPIRLRQDNRFQSLLEKMNFPK